MLAKSVEQVHVDRPKVSAAAVIALRQSLRARRARLASNGRSDILLIQKHSETIADSFYDIGEALVRLSKPGVAAALGRSNFGALLAQDLPMFSATRAGTLMGIVRRVSRQDAVRWGQDRSAALIELAHAAPAPETIEELARRKLPLPSGDLLDVVSASARDIRRAAKLIRADNLPDHKRSPGRSATTRERAQAADLQTKLRELGAPQARVTAVATTPSAGANVRIEFVPLASLAILKRAL